MKKWQIELLQSEQQFALPATLDFWQKSWRYAVLAGNNTVSQRSSFHPSPRIAAVAEKPMAWWLRGSPPTNHRKRLRESAERVCSRRGEEADNEAPNLHRNFYMSLSQFSSTLRFPRSSCPEPLQRLGRRARDKSPARSVTPDTVRVSILWIGYVWTFYYCGALPAWGRCEHHRF